MTTQPEPLTGIVKAHCTDDLDLRPADGWFRARCVCGWTQGPFSDAEAMVDALMSHTLDAARAEATPSLSREALIEVIHDATPVEQDGGVPDVCNRYPEHEAVADAILAALASDR